MEVILKSVINIFTVIDGKLNLITNNGNFIVINCYDNIEKENSLYIKSNLNINGLELKQCHTFSEKKDNKLFITVLYVDILNISNILLLNGYKFTEVTKLDKNSQYLKESINYLKSYIVLNSTIKKLYPDEFILPEIQKLYELILNKKYDRRNFRKRLIKLDVIEDLSKVSIGNTGRPAKLYKFKSFKEDRTLF